MCPELWDRKTEQFCSHILEVLGNDSAAPSLPTPKPKPLHNHLGMLRKRISLDPESEMGGEKETIHSTNWGWDLYRSCENKMLPGGQKNGLVDKDTGEIKIQVGSRGWGRLKCVSRSHQRHHHNTKTLYFHSHSKTQNWVCVLFSYLPQFAGDRHTVLTLPPPLLSFPHNLLTITPDISPLKNFTELSSMQNPDLYSLLAKQYYSTQWKLKSV